MKSSSILPLALITQTAHSLSLHRRNEPAVVGFSLGRRQPADSVHRDHLQKRNSSVGVDVASKADNGLYYFNLTVGTPDQAVSVSLDTGSSDLWVNVPDSDFCKDDSNDCDLYGTYDYSDSSSYKLVNHDFHIDYVDGTGAKGDYVSDTVKFGDVTLKDFQFGLGSTSGTSQGTLGIGYSINEAGDTIYPNLPKALVKADYIKSPAYSLWLDDIEHKGTILFGGVNTAKYHGDLKTVPIIPTDGKYEQLYVTLTGMSLKTDSSKDYDSPEFPLFVVLDSGASVNLLPDSLAHSIFDDLGATYYSNLGAAFVECDLKDKNHTLTYNFSGISITVNVSELVLASSDESLMCTFGIAPAGGASPILGDPFLRGTYVVYDLENNEISMANTNFNPSKDNVLEIGTGDNAVPKATMVASPVTTAINAPSATGTLGSSSTSSSEGFAPLATSNLKSLIAGLAGAGIFLSL